MLCITLHCGTDWACREESIRDWAGRAALQKCEKGGKKKRANHRHTHHTNSPEREGRREREARATLEREQRKKALLARGLGVAGRDASQVCVYECMEMWRCVDVCVCKNMDIYI